MPALRKALAAAVLCALGRGDTCGSIAFSGTSSYLTVSSPLYFTGDFTIECWAKADPSGTYVGFYRRLFTLYPSSGTSYTDSDIEMSYVAEDSVSVLSHGSVLAYAPYPGTGSWVHYALTRSGSTLSFFVDGTLYPAGTLVGPVGSASSVFRIGGLDPSFVAITQWNGTIADFRVIDGTAAYT